MLLLWALLSVQDKPDLSKTKLFVYDGEKGLTLRVKDDGKVELTVKDDKSYSAESAEDFEKKFPEVVKKHGLRKYLGSKGVVARDEFDTWWEELKKGRKFVPELPEFGNPLDEDTEKWLEDVLKGVRKRVPLLPPAPKEPAPAPSGKEFGVKIESVGETLRDQLSLKEGEGVLVGEVKPGSVADKSGVKQHDIILKLDGKAVADKWEFRKDLLKALDKPEFDLEILRGGKKETLKAKTGVKREE